MESKCPCCQAEMFYVHNSRAYQCGACPFRCHISYMPRIAAAMELARATTAWGNKTGGDSAFAKFKGAQSRALEVFGGE